MSCATLNRDGTVGNNQTNEPVWSNILITSTVDNKVDVNMKTKGRKKLLTLKDINRNKPVKDKSKPKKSLLQKAAPEINGLKKKDLYKKKSAGFLNKNSANVKNSLCRKLDEQKKENIFDKLTDFVDKFKDLTSSLFTGVTYGSNEGSRDKVSCLANTEARTGNSSSSMVIRTNPGIPECRQHVLTSTPITGTTNSDDDMPMALVTSTSCTEHIPMETTDVLTVTNSKSPEGSLYPPLFNRNLRPSSPLNSISPTRNHISGSSVISSSFESNGVHQRAVISRSSNKVAEIFGAKNLSVRTLITCNACMSEFDCSFVANYHKCRFSEKVFNPCYICHQLYITSTQLSVHMKAEHPNIDNIHIFSSDCTRPENTACVKADEMKNRPPTSDECLKAPIMDSRDNRDFHYYCECCEPPCGFLDSRLLVAHMLSSPPKKLIKYVCEMCSASYHSENILQEHMKLMHQ